MNRFYLIILFFYFYTASVPAQTNKSLPDELNGYLDFISDLSQRNEEETDFNQMADELYDLLQSPIDINQAGREDFSRLFWLSEFQVMSLTEYVEHHKPVVSLYELVYIPGFDTSFVRSISPFITISAAGDGGWTVRGTHQMVLLRTGRILEKQSGYENGNLEGNPWKMNFKYKFQQDEKWMAGVNLEKDAGETLWKGSNRAGPDFYSGYLKVNKLGKLSSICLGDFNTGFGQGLVVGSGFALGKTPQSTNLIGKETGIRPNSSTDENRFFRGIAATIRLKPLDVTVFASCKKMDAHISLRDSVDRIVEVSSLQTSGIHALAGEQADEDALKELSFGSRIARNTNKYRVGITMIHNQFDAAIQPNPTDYNQFYFHGKSQTNLGIDYKFLSGNVIFFGEEAVDKSGNIAVLNGFSGNLYNRLQMVVLHRYYSRAYTAFYGNAFGENSRVQNEGGVYGGMRFPLVKYVNISLFIDVFHFPWLKYLTDAPSHGREFMLQTDLGSGRPFNGYIQFRWKQKQLNAMSEDNRYHILSDNESKRFRIQMNYKLNERISLNSRLETGWFYQEGLQSEQSFLLYQDFQVHPVHFPAVIYFRYAVFDTDSYNSRIYAYENDVLYAFNSSAYYLKGQRYYILLKLTPVKKLNVWVRYARSVYPDEQSLSSGDYQISGNTRSDLRMQLIWNF